MLDTRLLRSDLDSVVANLARRGFAFDKQAFVALEERRKALAGRGRPAAQRTQHALEVDRPGQGAGAGHRAAAGGSRVPRRRTQAGRRGAGGRAGHARRAAARHPQPAARVGARGQGRIGATSSSAAGESRGSWTSRRWTTSRSARNSVGSTSSRRRGSPGARFAVMRGAVARLHRALAQFMLDLHTQRARLHGGLRALPGARARR